MVKDHYLLVNILIRVSLLTYRWSSFSYLILALFCYVHKYTIEIIGFSRDFKKNQRTKDSGTKRPKDSKTQGLNDSKETQRQKSYFEIEKRLKLLHYIDLFLIFSEIYKHSEPCLPFGHFFVVAEHRIWILKILLLRC